MEKWLKKITPVKGIIIGLVCLIMSMLLNKYFIGNLFSVLLQTLSATFIVASTIGCSIDSSVKAELVQLLSDNMAMCALCNEIGLYKILYSCDYNYNDLLSKSKELIIVMNDGKRWISNHYDILKERFKDENKKTTFVLLKPNSSALKLLAKKTRKDEQTVDEKISNINEKIQNSILELKQIKGNGNLRIYYSEAVNQQAMFLTECKAIITLYRTSTGIHKTKVPLLVYNKNEFSDENEYKYIKDDVNYLIDESEEVTIN